MIQKAGIPGQPNSKLIIARGSENVNCSEFRWNTRATKQKTKYVRSEEGGNTAVEKQLFETDRQSGFNHSAVESSKIHLVSLPEHPRNSHLLLKTVNIIIVSPSVCTLQNSSSYSKFIKSTIGLDTP